MPVQNISLESMYKKRYKRIFFLGTTFICHKTSVDIINLDIKKLSNSGIIYIPDVRIVYINNYRWNSLSWDCGLAVTSTIHYETFHASPDSSIYNDIYKHIMNNYNINKLVDELKFGCNFYGFNFSLQDIKFFLLEANFIFNIVRTYEVWNT